ncbi:MAG: HD domain-containing phosphohydrolase [Gemmatimonadaceae bacterium]
MSHRIPLAVLGAGIGYYFLRLHRETERIERLAAASFESLLNAIDANDPETGSHVRRVACYALILAQAADLDEHQCRMVERIALFHDIGKIHAALFDIIRDDAKLSPSERRLIATHPQRGAEVLSPLAAFYPDLADGVLSHHERWDGAGYPRQLAGSRIPLSARIVAIADSFDAITHRRLYRRQRSVAEAIEAIMQGRDTQYDPDLVDVFLSPPVVAEVERAMRSLHGPHRAAGHSRARTNEHADVPDVTFRWRSASRVQLAPDRESQTPRG